jgi:CRP-like cAMP-binding protein
MSKAILQNVYLFKTMNAQELEAVNAIAQSQDIMKGDAIFLKGEVAKALYLIKKGTVKIEHSTKSGDSIEVATLGAGSHFGEMAFVDNQPRSATATGLEPGEMVVVPYENLFALLTKNPGIAVKFYRELAHFLAGRLRVTTSDLSYAKEKNHAHF